MRAVELTSGKRQTCDRILRALPEWFGIEASIVEYVDAVDGMPMLVVAEDSHVLGFLSLLRQTDATSEVYVMGVEKAFHRRGVGRILVEAAADHARGSGCRLLSVKTLAASRPSPEYDRTRRFYEAMGFLPVEVFPALWGPANPCLLLVRPL